MTLQNEYVRREKRLSTSLKCESFKTLIVDATAAVCLFVVSSRKVPLRISLHFTRKLHQLPSSSNVCFGKLAIKNSGFSGLSQKVSILLLKVTQRGDFNPQSSIV